VSELVDEPGLGFGAIYWRESSSLSFFKMKKNLLKRLSFKKLEKQNRILKILYNNTILPKDKRTIYGQIRHELRSKSSLSIVRNTCIETYRNRAIITPYKISRFYFKKYASQALIAGLRKV
jgi:ribosomal protein S14